MDFFEITKIIYENSSKFSLEILKVLLEEMGNGIEYSKERKRVWKIIKIDTRTITTILGKVTFQRRYYQNKNTKRYAYLLNETVGLKKYQRLGEILEGKILEF